MDEQEVMRDFLIESNENLARLDREMVELESHPDDVELVASILRAVHTIKGTSGFLGCATLGEMTHHAAAMLGPLRDRKRTLNQTRVGLILGTSDAVREILSVLKATGKEGEESYADLIERLDAAASEAESGQAAAAEPALTAPPAGLKMPRGGG